MAKQQTTPFKAVTKMILHNAKIIERVNARAGNINNEAVAKAYETALQDSARVRAFLSGLVDEKLLVS